MIANIFVFIVAFIHIVISIVEMLFWNQRPVHERLNFNDDEARKVAPIVANAGLYNGFLAAGLIWGLLSHNGSPVRGAGQPRVIVTDKLRSYAAAKRIVMPGVAHRQHRYLNNRAENSHQQVDHGVGLYRIFRDQQTQTWFVEGLYN